MFVYAAACALLAVCARGLSETCTTRDGGPGSCISLDSCQPLKSLLQKLNTDPSAMSILKQAHCGFDGRNPKVCCPLSGFNPVDAPTSTISTAAAVDSEKSLPALAKTCPIIDGITNSCISLESCQPLLDLVQESKTNPAAKTMLRQAHCGFDGAKPKVCCPLKDRTPKSNGDFIPALPEPPTCGYSNTTLKKVVGGQNAKLGAFPWMALLGYKRGENTNWKCGGSLISSRHVLTAAHCIHNLENDLYLVRLGELDLARDDEGATPLDVLIKQQIKHEQYNAKAFTNDIALLVLERDVEFTDLIKPICIPFIPQLRSLTFEDNNPLIAGWGDTEFRGRRASHLQLLQLPVVSNEYCKTAYQAYKSQTIDERVLCAGFEQGGKDTCQGDSGGPLMQPHYNPEELAAYMYQIGVVSFGKKCAEPGFPGVYSRVTHFVPWIEEKVTGRSSR